LKKLQEFRNKLEEIFEIDKAELDFGIYRIINQKRTEINKFLNTLEDDVREELKSFLDITSIESDIYSHLTNFFSRYYSEGDFISQRRYKEGVYALPYEGEEVKLHWANHDQYYIKTSENFKNYVVKLDEDRKLIFHIVEASSEKNNNKESSEKERRFFLTEENSIEIKENEIIIKFEYNPSKEKQDKLNEKADEEILSYLKEENSELFDILSKEQSQLKKKPSKLLRELNNYTAKNSFDYFIHKDLGGFLKRELDFYIKNEVMFLDDLDEDRIKNSIVKVKAIKKIGSKIIKMLEQLENFQKKLWEKKKFVTETNYCFTIDKIFEKFGEEEQKDIFSEILSNEEQIKEWKDMYDFKITPEGTADTLKENDKLLIDTKYFSDGFTEKIISGFDDLEEELNGLLIHSENFQALNFMQEKYREKVKCVYIDPPYNAQSSEILYKNNYKHSSWMSLMYDRLNTSKTLLEENFVKVIAIDEVENMRLSFIISELYKNFEDSCISIQHNPTGQQGKNFSFTHEFAHFIFPYNVDSIGLENRDDKQREAKPDIRPLRNVSSGKNHLRESGANCFYPILIKESEIVGFGAVSDNDFNPESINVIRDDGVIEIYPIDPSGIESKWVFERNTVESILDELTPVFDKKKKIWDIQRKKTNFRYKSLWSDKRYNANSWGSVVLNNIIPNTPFTYPKSIYNTKDCVDAGLKNLTEGLILDFFAGSGTTGHAVIDLNRDDEGKRKYILVEMGEYFETVLKPRIKKVIYSKDWKNGKPVSREGISQIFKYIKLEQYEDTLNNLMINQPKSLFNTDKNFQKDYTLNYMMNFETKESPSLLNIDMFDNPFGYKMKILENNEMKNKNIDLIETFNFLIGLEIDRIEKTRYFDYVDNKLKETPSKESSSYKVKEVTGKTREGEKILVIWRNRTKDRALDNVAIEEYFRKQRYKTLDMEFDKIYINGDNTLQNIRKDGEHWKVELTEEKFKKMMFEEKTL